MLINILSCCSGKSSLVSAVLNLIERSGTIEIDGYDPKDLPPQLVRSRIAVIPQDPVILPGTVRDNIIPPDLVITRHEGAATDEEVISVLRDLYIWEHIRDHGGLAVRFSDMEFSHGQNQLVALARAVMHNRLVGTRIVIMDEATSHLDYEADKITQEYLMRAFEQCTVLNITHREDGFPKAGCVMRLENGRFSVSCCEEGEGSLSEKL